MSELTAFATMITAAAAIFGFAFVIAQIDRLCDVMERIAGAVADAEERRR